MPVCNRKGCGKEYDPANSDEACVFHPGAPVSLPTFSLGQRLCDLKGIYGRLGLS
jgi:hypothetical protein